MTIVPVFGRVRQWPHRKCYVQCIKDQRSFRRPGDLKRYKCLPERENPVHLQQGALQCACVGLRVLEALLSTKDHAIHIQLYFFCFPFMLNTLPLMAG